MGFVLVLSHVKLLVLFRCSRISRYCSYFGTLAYQDILRLVFSDSLSQALLMVERANLESRLLQFVTEFLVVATWICLLFLTHQYHRTHGT